MFAVGQEGMKAGCQPMQETGLKKGRIFFLWAGERKQGQAGLIWGRRVWSSPPKSPHPTSHEPMSQRYKMNLYLLRRKVSMTYKKNLRQGLVMSPRLVKPSSQAGTTGVHHRATVFRAQLLKSGSCWLLEQGQYFLCTGAFCPKWTTTKQD